MMTTNTTIHHPFVIIVTVTVTVTVRATFVTPTIFIEVDAVEDTATITLH